MDGKMEENEAVGMSYCELGVWVGGWVGGWVGRMAKESR